MPNWQDILTPSRVTKIVSRIRTPGSVLSRSLGMGPGGKNTEQISGRVYTYDIFDNVRAVSLGKQPGAPASTIQPNIVGNNTVRLARFAEKIPMDYEKVSNIRTLGENAGVQDKQGKRYIEAQGKYLAQRAGNVREFMLGSLSRGGIYYFHQNGADLVPTYATTNFGVDLQIPAPNKLIGSSFAAGLPMGTGSNIITASWATANTRIDQQLMQISAAFQAQVGQPLATVWCDSQTWLNILQNDFIRQLAGTAQEPFASNEMTSDKAEDGTPTGLMKGSIRGIPWLTFYIYDGVITVAGTDPSVFSDTRVIQNGYCIFSIDYDGEWMKMIEGSEPVKDNDLAPAVERFGLHSWVMEKADPARFELHTLQNVGLELTVPKALAIARVR